MTATEKVTTERKLPLTGPVPPAIAEKVAEYMKLPYTITMVRDDSPGGLPHGSSGLRNWRVASVRAIPPKRLPG